jgi:hypothetical protein
MALNGSPSLLDLYVDVVASNSAAYPGVKDRKVPLLEQRSQDFNGVAMLMRSAGVEQRIRGGTRIESQIVLDQSGDFGLMAPGQDWVWSSSSGHEYLTSHWRKRKATESIDEDELELGMGGGVFDSSAVAMSLLDIEKLKKAKLWTKAITVLENDLWVTGHGAAGATMETGTATSLPRSLISAVNEYVTGHGSAYAGMPVGWTTQHGLNPANFLSLDGTRSLLQCQQFGYDVSMSSAVTANHLFDRMDEAIDAISFRAVPMAETFNEESNLDGAPGIFTSRKGKTQWNRTARAHGEFFGVAGPNDPVQRSVFDGIPIIRVKALDGAAVYPRYSGNAATTGLPVVETSTSTNRGGRFWLFNPKYIKHYLRRNKAFQFRDWYALDQTNPEKYVCWLRLDDCIHFESFQRHAIVYPSTDQTTY